MRLRTHAILAGLLVLAGNVVLAGGLGPPQGQGNLQGAYNNGPGTIVTTAAKSISFTDVDGNDLLQLNKNFAGGGNALKISLAAAATGSGLLVTDATTAASSTLATGIAISISGGNNHSQGLEMADGANVAVSAASSGRLIYNASTQTFQVSVNGGAFSTLITSAADTLQQAYTGGPSITVTGANPVVVQNATNVTSNLLSLGELNNATSGDKGIVYTRSATPTGATTYTGIGIDVENTPTATNNWTETATLLKLNHAPSGAGVVTDTTIGAQISMFPNASSAIAGIRLSMRNMSSSGMGIQVCDAALPAAYTYSQANTLEEIDVTGGSSALAINVWNTNGTGAQPELNFNRSKAASIGTQTTTASGDFLGAILFNGSDGSSFGSAAYLQCSVDGAVAAGKVPGALQFFTRAVNSGSVSERFRLSAAGSLLIQNGTTVASSTVAGQFNWATGFGAITHILGPTDQPFIVQGGGTSSVTLGNGTNGNYWTLANTGLVTHTMAATGGSIGYNLSNSGTMTAGTTMGLQVDFSGMTSGANAVTGVNVNLGASLTNSADYGLFVTHAGTAGQGIRVLVSGASGTPFGIITEFTGSGAMTNPDLVAGEDSGRTWSGGGTESTKNAWVLFGPTISATATKSGSVLRVENTANVTGGTFTCSTTLVNIVHAPTLGGGVAITDTTTGLNVSMTPQASSAVFGQTITMGANTSTSGTGLQINGLAAAPGAFYGRLNQMVEENLSGTYGGIDMNSWSSNIGNAPVVDFCHSKSSTIGTHSAVAASDDLGYLEFRGSDGTAFQTGARIYSACDGTVAANKVPARLSFWTAPVATGTITERLRISNSGSITVMGTGGTLSTTRGQFQWDTGFGAIAQVLGPTDQNLLVEAAGTRSLVLGDVTTGSEWTLADTGLVTHTLSATSGIGYSLTSSAASAGLTSGLVVDFSGVTPGANAIVGVRANVPATTASDGALQAALVVDSQATVSRVIDTAIANTGQATGIWTQRWRASTTLTAATTCLLVDASTNVQDAGNVVTLAALKMAGNSNAANASIGLSVTRSGTANTAGNFTGNLASLTNTVAMTGASIEAGVLLFVNHAPTNNTGTDQTTVAQFQIRTANTGSTATGVNINVNPQGGTFASLKPFTITLGANYTGGTAQSIAWNSGSTLTAASTMLQLDGKTNLTPSTFANTPLSILSAANAGNTANLAIVFAVENHTQTYTGTTSFNTGAVSSVATPSGWHQIVQKVTYQPASGTGTVTLQNPLMDIVNANTVNFGGTTVADSTVLLNLQHKSTQASGTMTDSAIGAQISMAPGVASATTIGEKISMSPAAAAATVALLLSGNTNQNASAACLKFDSGMGASVVHILGPSDQPLQVKSASGNITLLPSSNLVDFHYAVTANGATNVPTLPAFTPGTVAAQSGGWLAIQVNGATKYIPVWN